MKGFIEVSWPEMFKGFRTVRLINIEHIVEVYPTDSRTQIVLSINTTHEGPTIETEMSYEEVKKLIEEAQK